MRTCRVLLLAAAAAIPACAGVLGLDQVTYERAVGLDGSLEADTSGADGARPSDARDVADGGPSDGGPAMDAGCDANLTADPANCGACGNACSLSCDNGKCARIIFVTTATTSGAIGGVDAGDALCNRVKPAAWGPAKFRAWLGTTSGDAPADRFSKDAGAGYITPTKVLVAASWNALVGSAAAPLTAYPNVTEDGRTLPGGDVWTGVAADGTAAGTSCMGWTVGDSGTGLRGFTDSNATGWTNFTTMPCGSPLHLYCVEQ